MPSMRVATSTENFTRIINALDSRFNREEVEGVRETDTHFLRRCFKNVFEKWVLRHEQEQAAGVVAPSPDIVEVTDE